MKKAIKIFLIIAYVGAGINIANGLAYCEIGDKANGYTLIVSAILSIIITVVADRTLEKATCKRDLRGIAIVTLLFSNVIAGVLMLCISDKDLVSPNAQQNRYDNPYNNPYSGQQYGSYSDPYGSPYGSPYGNPGGTPFSSPSTEEESDEDIDEDIDKDTDDEPSDFEE